MSVCGRRLLLLCGEDDAPMQCYYKGRHEYMCVPLFAFTVLACMLYMLGADSHQGPWHAQVSLEGWISCSDVRMHAVSQMQRCRHGVVLGLRGGRPCVGCTTEAPMIATGSACWGEPGGCCSAWMRASVLLPA